MSNLRITPIGTCRIHTPLRRAAGRYPVEMDLKRNYGFVHSSGEALQLVRFLQGDKTFAPETAPLIFREGDVGRYVGEKWEPGDLHVVEISSSKLIMSGGDAVQANYIAHHFADFFASPKRSLTFWTLVRKGHRGALLDFVRQQTPYERMPSANRKLLLSLTMEQQSYRSLVADMTEIVERLGKDKVVFVTHVNALTADDAVIPARDRLIRLVKAAAEQLGVPVYDPTRAMKRFGQQRAMENGGLDLTHFTTAFSDAVWDEFHEAYVKPLMAFPDEGGRLALAEPGAAAAAQLSAMLEQDDFEAAARKIHESATAHPDWLPVIGLRGVVRSRIADFSGAAADLDRSADDREMPQEMRFILLESFHKADDMAGALRVAENLLADEFQSSWIYSIGAEAAERLGRYEQAIFYAKQAFRRDHEDLAAALRALTIIAEHSDADEVAEWRAEIMENMAGATNGAFEICLWAVENKDEPLFVAAIGLVRAADKAGTIDLLEKAAEAGMSGAISQCIGLARDLGRLDPGLTQRRADIFQWVLDETLRLFEAGKPSEAHRLAQSLAELAGESALRLERFAVLAARVTRVVERGVRKGVRIAYSQRDDESIIRLGDSSADILLSDPDAAVIVARTYHANGRERDAIAYLTSVQSANPDHFGARRWLARYAGFARSYALAINMYGGLDRSNPGFAPIAREVERYLAKVVPHALKEVRGLLEADRTEEAFVLINALRANTAAGESCERELVRKHRSLRKRLVEIERNEEDLEEREEILRMMLRIEPTDVSALRRLALECMRQFRFAEAAEYWETLRSLSPDNESVVRNRERCQILAQRRAKTLMKQAAA